MVDEQLFTDIFFACARLTPHATFETQVADDNGLAEVFPFGHRICCKIAHVLAEHQVKDAFGRWRLVDSVRDKAHKIAMLEEGSIQS